MSIREYTIGLVSHGARVAGLVLPLTTPSRDRSIFPSAKGSADESLAHVAPETDPAVKNSRVCAPSGVRSASSSAQDGQRCCLARDIGPPMPPSLGRTHVWHQDQDLICHCNHNSSGCLGMPTKVRIIRIAVALIACQASCDHRQPHAPPAPGPPTLPDGAAEPTTPRPEQSRFSAWTRQLSMPR